MLMQCRFINLNRRVLRACLRHILVEFKSLSYTYVLLSLALHDAWKGNIVWARPLILFVSSTVFAVSSLLSLIQAQIEGHVD